MSQNLGATKYANEIKRRNRVLMNQLANNSKNFYQVKNWEAQGFIDESVEKWKPVENKPVGQKILVVTGRLRRSAFARVTGLYKAVVGFDAPYASYVNKLRQFIGESKTLDKENRQIIVKFINKIFRLKL